MKRYLSLFIFFVIVVITESCSLNSQKSIKGSSLAKGSLLAGMMLSNVNSQSGVNRHLLASPTASPTNTVVQCTDKVNLYYTPDASGSLGYQNFETVKSFSEELTLAINVDTNKNDTRIGINEFNTDTEEYLKLGYYAESDIIDVIKNDLEYDINGYTNTPQVLNDTLSAFLPYAGENNILVMLTDGFPCLPNGNCPIKVCSDIPNDPTVAVDYGQLLYDANIQVIIIEVGPVELFSMVDCLVPQASRNTNIIRVGSYDPYTLSAIIPQILNHICVFPTHFPTVHPTLFPSLDPTLIPTDSPTVLPTVSPSKSPTTSPTKTPTISPTDHPTITPTVTPTVTPTKTPTEQPTKQPSTSPSKSPTLSPTLYPTDHPTHYPTHTPTSSPSGLPTKHPSKTPTEQPTKQPTDLPTKTPTAEPSVTPTTTPTQIPTFTPSTAPTKSPTIDCSYPMNILMAIDRTGYNSHQDFDQIKNFTVSVLKNFNHDIFKIGLLTICNNSTIDLPLAVRDKNDVAININNLNSCSGHRNTNHLLSQTMDIFHPNFQGEPNLIFYISNGLPCTPTDCPSDICMYNSLFVEKGINLLSLSLGTDYNINQFNCFDYHTFLSSSTYDNIFDRYHEVLDNICVTLSPTESPTYSPSKTPTITPTITPTEVPTIFPTTIPTSTPSAGPTKSPSLKPTGTPSKSPTIKPTTNVPTLNPTTTPTQKPTLTPTLFPSISPTVKPTPFPTTSCQYSANVIFLLDESGSVGSRDFGNSLGWLSNNIQSLNLAHTDVGIIEFSTNAAETLVLGHHSPEFLRNFIDNNITYNGGFTNTPAAIELAKQRFDTINNADLNIVVLITDGMPCFYTCPDRQTPCNSNSDCGGQTCSLKCPVDICQYQNLLYSQGTRVIILGIGPGAQDSSISCFVKHPDDMILALSYSLTDLDNISSNMFDRLCQTLYPSPSPSNAPTESPSASPTPSPTDNPTVTPTSSPTKTPTIDPTTTPTTIPTVTPSKSPTVIPTKTPTVTPTMAPTNIPTLSPSHTPTVTPTITPTNTPSKVPSITPTESPVIPACFSNVYYITDASSSIGPATYLEIEKIIEKTVHRLDTNNTRFGLTEFANEADEILSLDSYDSRTFIQGFIDAGLKYRGNYTNMPDAISNSLSAFAPYNNEKNVLIIATDGVPCLESTCPVDVCHYKNDLDLVNVRTLILQFGPIEQYSLINCLLKQSSDLIRIANNPSDAYLNSVADRIVDDLCSSISPTLSPVPTNSPTEITFGQVAAKLEPGRYVVDTDENHTDIYKYNLYGDSSSDSKDSSSDDSNVLEDEATSITFIALTGTLGCLLLLCCARSIYIRSKFRGQRNVPVVSSLTYNVNLDDESLDGMAEDETTNL